jgi:DNA-binding MarR family transcriptional regulator
MFERCLYFNVNALARAVNRIWDEAFSEFGLSPSHAYLLRLALSSPGLTAKQISRELKLEKSTVSRFVDVMETKGFIRRKRGVSDDARELGIYPTGKAEQVARKLENRGNQLYRTMIDRVGKEALSALVRELRQAEKRLS